MRIADAHKMFVYKCFVFTCEECGLVYAGDCEDSRCARCGRSQPFPIMRPGSPTAPGYFPPGCRFDHVDHSRAWVKCVRCGTINRAVGACESCDSDTFDFVGQDGKPLPLDWSDPNEYTPDERPCRVDFRRGQLEAPHSCPSIIDASVWAGQQRRDVVLHVTPLGSDHSTGIIIDPARAARLAFAILAVAMKLDPALRDQYEFRWLGKK